MPVDLRRRVGYSVSPRQNAHCIARVNCGRRKQQRARSVNPLRDRGGGGETNSLLIFEIALW